MDIKHGFCGSLLKRKHGVNDKAIVLDFLLPPVNLNHSFLLGPLFLVAV